MALVKDKGLWYPYPGAKKGETTRTEALKVLKGLKK